MKALLVFTLLLLLLVAGVAGAEELANVPDMPSPGDDVGQLGEGFPWHYLVGVLVACACAIWL